MIPVAGLLSLETLAKSVETMLEHTRLEPGRAGIRRRENGGSE